VGKKIGPNPTDRGKCGTKLSLATDAAGVPLAVVVAGANCNDHKLLAPTLAEAENIRPKLKRPPGLCLDKGYDYLITFELAAAYDYQLHLRRRGEDRPQRRPHWKPRRWVVERTHSWLHRSRRLLVRWEKKAPNFLAMVHLACALTTLNAISISG
jgi:putative transposase